MNENEKNQRMLIGGVKCDQVGQIFTTLAIFFKVLGNISEYVFGILKDFCNTLANFVCFGHSFIV